MITRATWRRVGRLGAIVVALALLVGAAGWRLSGGSWRVVESPSMGRAAPVGTLLWVRPAPFAALRVGQLITFHPPTDPRATFTHRIVAIDPNSGLATRGDLNGTVDPWHLRAANVIGRVQARWWDVGWLIKALPILLVGAAVVFALTYWLAGRTWRLLTVLVGSGAVLSVAVYVVRPLVRASLISFTAAPGGARALVVGTGILPIDVTAAGGGRARLSAGQLGAVLVGRADRDGGYSVHVAAHLPSSWIVVETVLVFSPTIYGLVIGYRPAVEADGA